MTKALTPALLALTLALLSGCASSEATGSATFSVSVPQGLETTVARISVVITATDFPPLTLDLAPSNGVWGGILDNIPAGSSRSFRAQAFDAANTVQFDGSVSGVTITPGQITLVTLLLQQVTPPTPPQYEPPVIDSLVASTTTVKVAEAVSLSVTARDANPCDTLVFAWSATAGAFASAASASTTWTAPTTPGLQTLTVTVTDSTGLSSSASIALHVIRAEDSGSARLSVGLNRSPIITSLSLSPTRVAVGEATTVSSSASDLDGDALSRTWSVSCAGSLSSTTAATLSFIPSALPSEACNNCRLTLRVADGRGLSTTGSISLCVSNAPRINHFAPRLLGSSQSSTTVTAGGTVSFEVSASDPENTALSFVWSANLGAVGTPATTATGSQMTWTAPACAVKGTTPSITATVTNAFNLTASKRFTLGGLPDCPSGWAPAGDMGWARYGHSMTPLPDGKVLIIGGAGSNSLATAEVYDPATSTRTPTGSMSVARYGHTATLLPTGKVLVAGGRANSLLNSAELYDPATGTWSATGSMIASRSLHTAILLPTGKVLVCGQGSSSFLGTELYDPATGTWSTTGSMRVSRGLGTATLLPNGKVLAVGGHPSDLLIELYDPATGIWSAAGNMPAPRERHTATLLPNGRVLIAAGVLSGGVTSSTALYNPATGSWSATGNMLTPRMGHTATLLPTGKVLVAAGSDSSPLSSAELYDPATQAWSNTQSLGTSRTNATAILLPDDGTVLVSGGYTPVNNIHRSLERYTP